jgi:hypothetical protein
MNKSQITLDYLWWLTNSQWRKLHASARIEPEQQEWFMLMVEAEWQHA